MKTAMKLQVPFLLCSMKLADVLLTNLYIHTNKYSQNRIYIMVCSFVNCTSHFAHLNTRNSAPISEKTCRFSVRGINRLIFMETVGTDFKNEVLCG
jgi:hypothetical protein